MDEDAWHGLTDAELQEQFDRHEGVDPDIFDEPLEPEYDWWNDERDDEH